MGYPVRMKEDLLPFTNLTARETVELLGEQLSKDGCQATEARILDLVDQQVAPTFRSASVKGEKMPG